MSIKAGRVCCRDALAGALSRLSTDMSAWLGTAVGAALAAVPLCWTLLVLHRGGGRGRAAWLPLDVLLAALAWQGLVQQAAALLYSLLAMSLLGPLQWCSAATWLLASGQTLQAGTLVTLAVTRLLLLRRVTAVTRTHLVYHLISLTLLSACVGITAVLARDARGEQVVPQGLQGPQAGCAFLPHELDPRYAVLSLSLHSAFLLAAVLVAAVCCCLRRPGPGPGPGRVAQPRLCRLAQGLALPLPHRRRQHNLFTSSSDLSSALSDFSSVSASAMGTLSHPQGPVAKTFWNYCSGAGGGATAVARSNPSTLGKDDPPSITFLNGLPPGYPGDTLEKALQAQGPYSAESTLGRGPGPGPLAAALGSPLSALRSLDNSLEHRYRELCGGEYSDSTLNRDFGLRSSNNNNWTSDNSYMSTTTSPTSTNSRAPCLSRPAQLQQLQQLHHLQLPCTVPEEQAEDEAEALRLPTVLAVLALCYVTNHIPILVSPRDSVNELTVSSCTQ
ncbi:HTH-type transcriptional activator Btr [Frankliniella fusca]|uniref:HTH-type transcriptional activator Btr n=1 Tax=Frankliniella fusca TaxID=407009 RepID=A0AAE1GYL8_9NEOP|nr:HTH-type transcriptional activator Btr [Frankliniella fusca]